MKNEISKLIHIDWDGPFRLLELNTLTDEEKDYGIYKICGIKELSFWKNSPEVMIVREKDNHCVGWITLGRMG